MTYEYLGDAERRLVLEIAQSLVKIPSHSGDERAVIQQVVAWMEQLGYEDVRVDACGNAIGRLKGSDGPTVLYDSHVDTVPAGDETKWTYPPYEAVVVDDRMYGRGTADMKGALAATIVGLKAVYDAGKLCGTALVCASVGEEHIEGLALDLVLRHYQPDLVVICEPTALRLNTAQRGRAEINIAVHGKSAHASSPHLGINAFRHAARLAVALDEIQPPHDAQLGYGILEPTTAVTTPYPNVSVVPWRCDIRYDRRLLVGETQADALASIEEVIARLAAEYEDFSAEAVIVPGEFICYTGLRLTQETFAPAWRLTSDNLWVRAAQRILNEPEIGHYSFCTNGSTSLGRGGIPTFGYGPGDEQVAHAADEYLELTQLFGAVEGYARLGTLTGI